VRWFGAVVLAGIIAAGCSGGGGKNASTSTTRPAPTTTTPTAAATSVAVAKAGLLKLSDLPPGWKGVPHVPTDQSESALNKRIAACLGVDLTLVNTDRQPHADSEDFTGPAGQQVTSGVAVFRSPALPTEWLTLYSTPKARTCLAQTVGNPIDPPKPSVLRLRKVGDGVVGVRLTASGVVVDAAFARRGRALAYLAVVDPKGVDESALLTTMISRLPASP